MTKFPILLYLLILHLPVSASALSQRSLHRTIGVYSERIRDQLRYPSLSARTITSHQRESEFLPTRYHTTRRTHIDARNVSRLNSNAVSNENTNQDKKNDSTDGTKTEEKDDISPSISVTTAGNSGTRKTLLGVSLTYLTVSSVLAKLNVLGSYTNELLARDVAASLLCTILALIFVKTITHLAARGTLEARDSRKIIHMCSAPLFMITWPLFTDNPGARVFAAFVPALQCCRLWLAGTKQGGSDGIELAGAISRSGDAAEALKGPFIYVVILFAAIMLFFRDSLTGVIALSTMAAGDGLADIFGRRFGKYNKWPFNSSKSVAGSAAFVMAASICSFGLSAWLIHSGAITTSMTVGWELAQRVILISIVSAGVELLPVGDDNWSVPIAAGALSSLIIS